MRVQVLKLSLHDHEVGYLLGYQDGRSVLEFSQTFQEYALRPTFSLITHPNFPTSTKLMQEPWVRRMRLHPTLSNLLPEGALRLHIAQSLKVHVDNEFPIFAYLGRDLPGALIAEPVKPDELPTEFLNKYIHADVVDIEFHGRAEKFSLAGVQMKFSMTEQDGRFNLMSEQDGNWIIKTPSTRHAHVPKNEYTAMRLAELVGVEIPEIRLVELNKVKNLPSIPLPDESLAFAIKRFDRISAHENNIRVHTEDFAQVFMQYAHDKYASANYEQIGEVLVKYSGSGTEDAEKMVRRLLVNILLANGDAHLKNWSLIYHDNFTPRLSPAYDILTTKVYIENETQYALNMAKTKDWYSVSFAHFKHWAERIGMPWRLIRKTLNETLTLARELWPDALDELPMIEPHKAVLRQHWKDLHKDLRL